MNPAILSIATFAAVCTAVAAVASLAFDLFLRDNRRINQRIDDEFRQRQRDRVRKSLLFKDLGQIASEVAGARPTLRQRVTNMVEQSGLDLTVDRLLMIVLIAGAIGGAVCGLLMRELFGIAIGLAAGAALPLAYVNLKRNKRVEAMRAQLPDAFDLMSRVVRAGQTVTQAQQAVADEFGLPISYEFALCAEQQNLGLSSDLAMRDLARRTGLLEIKIFVTALLVQQQTGGNLAELLDNLASTVRARFRTRGKIKALTAEARYQALVLIVLPAGLYGLMLLVNREFAGVLLEYPSILMGVAISEFLGWLWIRKIVNFDF